jgi:hypothetical protein
MNAMPANVRNKANAKSLAARAHSYVIYHSDLMITGMSSHHRRPLPAPPAPPMGARPNPYPHTDLHPYFSPYPYPSFAPPPNEIYDEPTSGTIPPGTLLHQGFYDLLAMIPTPSPSSLIWGTPPPPSPDSVIAGPRYEDIGPPVAQPLSARKGRRISKNMVSKPTGFVYVFVVWSTTYGS